MVNQIFVNLPVKDLKKTIEFWTKLGFKFNPNFTDENATCLILGDKIFAMLMTEKAWTGFTPGRSMVDTAKSLQVLNALQLGSKEEVDALFEKVVAAGGKAYRPTEDLGFMYNRPFMDIDGHVWEPFFYDESKEPKKS
ncbi:MAG TPA: VOC family protein [Candidatus Peribacteraceae bacterium]|nr:VOC family protein [Candidatus Peribacteraceae bacterium]